MECTRTRGATVLFLAAALVATPVAAGPHSPTGGDAWAQAVVDSLGSWIAGLWPEAGAEGPSPALRVGLSTDGDPVGTETGGGIEVASGPTEDPERGGVADPNG